MQIIILHQSYFPEIPESLIRENYGIEKILLEDNEIITGDIIHLEGKDEDIFRYLEQLESFWMTRNPSAQHWDLIEKIK